jgi:dCTP deaminase
VKGVAVLSDTDIQRRITEGSLVLDPFESACLNGGGYDLRVSSEIRIPPGRSMLTATLERVELGEDMVGTLHIRSSLARAGIIASLALIDPGFHGQLTIMLYNSASQDFILKRGERFVQLAIHLLGTKTRRAYGGRYQDSKGIVERRP